MKAIITLIKKLFESSFIRFAMVGAFASAVNYGVYLFMLQFVQWPTLCYILAFSISVTCNFFLSSWFTFCVPPSWSRAAKFLTAHLINLVNELLLLNLFLWLGMSKYYAPLCVFVVAFPINFLMVRFALKGKLLRRIFQAQ